MSKAILVMDMPKSCDECPLFGSHYSDMTCRANGKSINYPYPKDFKQDWCPLREVLEKKEVSPYDGHCMNQCCTERERGYNDCINEILKG